MHSTIRCVVGPSAQFAHQVVVQAWTPAHWVSQLVPIDGSDPQPGGRVGGDGQIPVVPSTGESCTVTEDGVALAQPHDAPSGITEDEIRRAVEHFNKARYDRVNRSVLTAALLADGYVPGTTPYECSLAVSDEYPGKVVLTIAGVRSWGQVLLSPDGDNRFLDFSEGVGAIEAPAGLGCTYAMTSARPVEFTLSIVGSEGQRASAQIAPPPAATEPQGNARAAEPPSSTDERFLRRALPALNFGDGPTLLYDVVRKGGDWKYDCRAFRSQQEQTLAVIEVVRSDGVWGQVIVDPRDKWTGRVLVPQENGSYVDKRRVPNSGALVCNFVVETNRPLFELTKSVTDPSPSRREQEAIFAFMTPGNAVYCSFKSRHDATTNPALLCWTPNDGFWVRLGHIGEPTKGYAPIYKAAVPDGFPSLPFGQKWRWGCSDGGGDAVWDCGRHGRITAHSCRSSATGLTCNNAAGHGFWLGRYRGYKLF